MTPTVVRIDRSSPEPRLLDAAATPQAPRLRVAALQALQALTDAVPAAHLDAYRRQVVQALGRPHRGVDAGRGVPHR